MPEYHGRGPRPAPRYRTVPEALFEHATTEGRRGFQQVTWRHGTEGPMRSKFRAIPIRPASQAMRDLVRAKSGGRG